MKELSLQEIQHYSLKVLLHVHDFCVAHDIPYSLAYGTLIGAVRHKGFIPWDDDIDIIMTRENFDRFVREYQSDDHFKLVSPEDKNSFLAFARVCDMKDTLIVTRSPWSNYTTGVWIDIFPMDSISDNEAEHKKRWEKLSRSWTFTGIARGAKARAINQNHWKKPNYLIWIKKIIFFNGVFVRSSIKRFIKKIKSPKFANSAHCAQLACCDEWGFYEKKDFEEYTTLEFEGHQLMVIKEYDKVLRLLYGDYMQLPPEKDQVPKQSDYIRFYHKE
ncbi:MAG: LicD family protein [Muribaculaceae bacterium]|nr:LicD family protein [Muribaculaceae bacterium]